MNPKLVCGGIRSHVRTGFEGPGSANNFLRSVRKLSGLYGDDACLDTNTKFYDPDALPLRCGLMKHKPRLPPIEIARRLFAAQYTYIGTIFFFTDPQTFERLLLEAYRGPPDTSDRDARLTYAKVLMILAFGQLYSINQWVDFKGPPGFSYFTAALDLLPEAHEEGSILAVETLAYVGYFMQNMNRRDAAFLYIGMALRMAISLGLHQEATSLDLDNTTREHRRRVWWSIYSLDRIVTVKSGNPLTIQDEDIGVAMPMRLPSEPEYCPAVVLRHYTQLSRILGEMTSCVYRNPKKSGIRLMESVRNIMVSLSKWYQTLPPGLRFDPAKLSISRESVSTFLHYYQCINMTARPLLFHVVQQRLKSNAAGTAVDWKSGLSQTTVGVIEMCISAAEDTVHMMTLSAQLDLVATYGYMDSEHAFSAAIVLVMVSGAFPDRAGTTQAMNAGLELLKSMAQRGNGNMAGRYELLAHLKSILLPPSDHAISPAESSGTLPSFTAMGGAGYSQSPAWNGTPISLEPNAGCVNAGLANVPAVVAGSATPLLEHTAFPSYFTDDINDFANAPLGDDFMLWEAGFADPAGYDLSQWMQATQMVVDREALPQQ